jgi:hypothetical protein
MSNQLQRLTDEVRQTSTVMASAAVLIAGLSAQLRDAASDPAAITKLADDLDASQKSLSDAIVAYTPSSSDPSTPIGGAPDQGSGTPAPDQGNATGSPVSEDPNTGAGATPAAPDQGTT